MAYKHIVPFIVQEIQKTKHQIASIYFNIPTPHTNIFRFDKIEDFIPELANIIVTMIYLGRLDYEIPIIGTKTIRESTRVWVTQKLTENITYFNVHTELAHIQVRVTQENEWYKHLEIPNPLVQSISIKFKDLTNKQAT